MQRRHGSFDLQSFGIGTAFGIAAAWLIHVALIQPDGLGDLPPAQPVATVPVSECAVRTVYFTSTQDDWGQRALIASAVLNRASAPGVDARLPCAYPSPLDAGAPLPDPYLLQSARDAVEAVASGSYEIPPACAGATEVLIASASPRAQCVYGGLAFVEAR